MKRLVIAALLVFAPPAFAQHKPLSAERESELRATIMSATQAADFDRNNMMLEVYRTLRGAGATLSTSEMFEMSEAARKRGLSGESAAAAAPLFSDGVPVAQVAVENRLLLEHIRKMAAEEINGGLEASVKAAEQRANKEIWSYIAQGFAGIGDDARAVGYYYRALAPDPRLKEEDIPERAAELAQMHRRSIEFYLLELREKLEGPQQEVERNRRGLIMLNLGISLFRLGRIEEARGLWTAVESDGAVGILADVWMGLADAAPN